MRAVCSQLAIFEKEVDRLTETQASAQEEWKSKTGHLESELNQATAEKVDISFQQKPCLQQAFGFFNLLRDSSCNH